MEASCAVEMWMRFWHDVSSTLALQGKQDKGGLECGSLKPSEGWVSYWGTSVVHWWGVLGWASVSGMLAEQREVLHSAQPCSRFPGEMRNAAVGRDFKKTLFDKNPV